MSILDDLAMPSGWYAVRCVFESTWPAKEPDDPRAHRYEERITLWQASSLDEAIELAQIEAEGYARAISESPSPYLGLAQGYALTDLPGNGAEVFSLMRSSDRDPDDYLNHFFDTGDEHQGQSS